MYLPVLASVLDLADNFFLISYACLFWTPFVGNLSHVRNIFFESSCMYMKEGQLACMLSQDYVIHRIYFFFSSLFSFIF
jgi:hypothetical protein